MTGGGPSASASGALAAKTAGDADERGKGGGIAGLELNRKPRCGRAVDDRGGGNAARARRAREVDDDPGLASRKQAEAKALYQPSSRGAPSRPTDGSHAEADLRHVDDDAIRRGQGGRAARRPFAKGRTQAWPRPDPVRPGRRPQPARPRRRRPRAQAAPSPASKQQEPRSVLRAIQLLLGAARPCAIEPMPAPRNRRPALTSASSDETGQPRRKFERANFITLG